MCYIRIIIDLNSNYILIFLILDLNYSTMARYTNGIHGPFSGLVGTVVGASRNGKPYMRSRPSKRTIPARPKEAANRRKFAEAQSFLQPLLDFVREGFKGYSDKSEGFVAAKSHLLRNAFEGEGEHRKINPALVKICYGDLPLPDNIVVEHVGNGQIKFSWDIVNTPNGRWSDQVMLLAYDIEKGNASSILHGQLRMNGSDVLEMTGYKGTVHLYIAFESADRSRRSESVYLGAMEL
jgi:hypothetical protein